jgi:hypothetical protein
LHRCRRRDVGGGTIGGNALRNDAVGGVVHGRTVGAACPAWGGAAYRAALGGALCRDAP